MKKLVTLRTFRNQIEVQFVKNLLEENDIETFIIDENTSMNYGFSIIGIRLQIYSEDEERAKEILIENEIN